VLIGEARIAESGQRDAEIMRLVVEHKNNVAREIYDLSNGVRIVTECWLTFRDSNLTLADDSGTATPLFWAGMTEREFKRNFGLLPVDLALEWHTAVMAYNPQWELVME
jgi:hypothetical protein